MSGTTARILEQLHAQNDLRMEAEQHLEQATAAEEQAFTPALKKDWIQTELNKIGAPPPASQNARRNEPSS